MADDPDYVPDWGELIPNKRPRREHRPKVEIKPPEEMLEDAKKLDLHIEPSAGIAYPPLRVAAFNVQTFGKKKLREKDVTHILVRILQRYDLILIQEIRDRSHTALDKLVELCSSVDPDDPFTAIVSERLGRTRSKEQYAFMYRYSKIKLQEVYQYDDGEDNGSDVFQREPFAVRFTSPTTTIKDFAIIAIHTDPDDAVREIAGLAKVYDVTKAHWGGLEDIIIAGDFNADEGYVHRDDWSKIALRNDRRFKWMIDDETDTTVGNTDRAYDRFVVAGKKLVKAVVPGSAGAFKFDDEFGLSNDEAEEISDHYPIEMKITGKPNMSVQNKVETSMSITVHQKVPIDDDRYIRKIYRTDSGTAATAFFTHNINYDDSRMREVVARRNGVEDVVSCLKEFQASFPKVLLDETLEMVQAFLNTPLMMQNQYIYGLVKRDQVDYSSYDITVTASLDSPLDCHINVAKRLS